MKVKNKLRLGFAFLFIVVLFFGAMATFLINQMANSGKVLLKNNYETLLFTREMRKVLDENSIPLPAEAAKQFNNQLVNQEHNITEKGEGRITKSLRLTFTAMQAPGLTPAQTSSMERQLRQHLRYIEKMNMDAIWRKNSQANKSVDKTIIILGLVATFTFLILFSFSVNFPDAIAKPLTTLLSGIREISKGNYKQRIHFGGHQDEFAEVANAFNDMARRLNDWENSNLSKIMSEKQRIETIIEQMQDAIVGIDEKQQVLFINTSAKIILGLNEQAYQGQEINTLASHNDLLKSIISNNKAGKPFRVVMNGKDAFYQLESTEICVPNISPNPNETLNITHASAGRVYILRNVTEFKQLDEAKTNFIATISHELKTPISSIRMSLKLLNDVRVGDVNTEQRQLIKHIEEDAGRLLKITSELLELSQVETGNIQLNFIPVEPIQIVKYAVEAVKLQAEQKQVELQITEDKSLPKVQVDLEKTAWVLVNFLSNALRYSPERSKVHIDIIRYGNMVEFSVKDHGKGIDEQFQKRLFDRYFQVPTDGQNKSGSGLGLAISKDFIEVQQGKIGLESALGEGSRFFFRLPGVTVV